MVQCILRTECWVQGLHPHSFPIIIDSILFFFLLSFRFLGYLCCTITVLFFAAPLSMLLQVFRYKSTEMLPFPLILTSFLVSIQWFIVGLLINDLFLQLPNFIGSLLSGTQLLLFVIYPNKPKIPVTPINEPPYSIFTNVM